MEKKNRVLIGIFLVIIVILISVIVFGFNYIKNLSFRNSVITENSENINIVENEDYSQNVVLIKNGQIKNEYLIDEFINNANKEKELQLEIIQENDNIKLMYIPGENEALKIEENETVTQSIPKEDSAEEYRRIYGYYLLVKNNQEINKLDCLRFSIKRRCEDNDVYLTFSSIETMKLKDYIDICKYSLNSSNYKKRFEMNYYQRKDLGIKTIIDKDNNKEYDYGFYTFGGDVTIAIDGDMVYSLEDAINQKVISIEDILNQAQDDSKYGICDYRYFSDGGSIEYGYSNYTILKYDKLDGNKDLIIGMSGEIINKVNDILD